METSLFYYIKSIQNRCYIAADNYCNFNKNGSHALKTNIRILVPID